MGVLLDILDWKNGGPQGAKLQAKFELPWWVKRRCIRMLPGVQQLAQLWAIKRIHKIEKRKVIFNTCKTNLENLLGQKSKEETKPLTGMEITEQQKEIILSSNVLKNEFNNPPEIEGFDLPNVTLHREELEENNNEDIMVNAMLLETKMLEIFAESAPQAVLQWSILKRTNGMTVFLNVNQIVHLFSLQVLNLYQSGEALLNCFPSIPAFYPFLMEQSTFSSLPQQSTD